MTWRRASIALREDRHAMEATQAWMARRLVEALRTVEQVLDGPFLVAATAGPADFYLFMVAGWWRRGLDFAAETPRLAAYLHNMTGSSHVRGAYEAQGSDLPQFRSAATPAA